jgi:uncharacterized protein with von Willebrand factor type A (vWA) domain
MIALRDAILELIADLRGAEVRISVAESLDAMRAVAASGIERGPLREALAAALIKEEADRAIFDETFSRRFGSARPDYGDAHRSLGERTGLHGASGGPSESSMPEAARAQPDDEAPAGLAPTRKPSQARDRPERITPTQEPERRDRRDGSATDTSDESSANDDSDSADDEGQAVGSAEDASAAGGRETDGKVDSPGIEAGRAAALRTIERMPFANYSDIEFVAARDALAALKRRFRIRVSRRLRLAGSGRIDFRRTIRASLQHGGALGDRRFRARRPRHLDLLILADISGSVKYASTLMLEIVAGAAACFRRVRSFVYIDKLSEAGFEEGHLALTPPLDLYARSDFGSVLKELWSRRAALISRATVIVIMGDGRNNRRPARADLLRDLARLSRTVLWLIPEPQARWNTGDSAIRQYARECSALIPCENLRELERALIRVT